MSGTGTRTARFGTRGRLDGNGDKVKGVRGAPARCYVSVGLSPVGAQKSRGIGARSAEKRSAGRPAALQKVSCRGRSRGEKRHCSGVDDCMHDPAEVVSPDVV